MHCRTFISRESEKKLATFLAENSARNINTACCIEQVQKAGKKVRKNKLYLTKEVLQKYFSSSVIWNWLHAWYLFFFLLLSISRFDFNEADNSHRAPNSIRDWAARKV